MNTDCEFKNEHRGHQKKVEGEEFSKTVSISTGFTPSGTGKACCPLCEVEEIVEVTNKICKHHEYGRHIKIKCEECGVEGTTKNIGYIGARSLFISCSHSSRFLKHIC